MSNTARYYLTPALKVGKFIDTVGNLYNLELPFKKVVSFHPSYLTFNPMDKLSFRNGKPVIKLFSL